jgi:hypothetical protein
MKGKKSSPYKMKGKNKKSPLKAEGVNSNEVTQKDFDDMSFSDQADYLNNNKDSDISKSISSNVGAYNVENNKVVNSASTSSSTSSSDKNTETKKGKTPNDALANRLVSSIERGGRKSKVRKSTRTAKKASRQEAKQTGNPKAKVSKLGIDPRTGNAFKTAKAKSDYIDNRSSDDSKSNTSTSSTEKEKYNNIPSIVPNSIEKVPVAERPKLYDDGKSDPKKDGSKVKMSRAEKKYLKSKSSKGVIKEKIKKIKGSTSRKERKKDVKYQDKDTGKNKSAQDRLKELKKEKRNSPNKMKKNSPVKNYKKGYYGAK